MLVSNPLYSNGIYNHFKKNTDSLEQDIYEEVSLEEIAENQEESFTRQTEINQLIDYLSIEGHNAVVISAASQLRKTHLVNSLIKYSHSAAAPSYFKDRRFVKLKIPEKASRALRNLQNEKDKPILIIEEAQTVFENTSQCELLKARIPCHKVPIIVLSTQSYGKNTFLADQEWYSKFHHLSLKNLTINETLQILQSTKTKYEKKLQETYFPNNPIQISIHDEAIDSIIKLCDEYYVNEPLQDKALKVLEIVCSKAIHSKSAQPDALSIEITMEDVKIYFQEYANISPIKLTADLKKIEERFEVSPFPPDEPLIKYSKDLRALVIKGEIKPVFGRDDELKQIQKILWSAKANNVLLVGPSGCGKTRIVEGLTYLIQMEKVSEYLKDKAVLYVHLSTLLSGNYDQSPEEKLKLFFESAARYEGTFILVMDEIHRLFGANQLSQESAKSYANELKLQLEKGKLRLIGITTSEEYRKYIKCDPALKRRFTTITVEPLTPDQSIQAIQQDKANLELEYLKTHHRQITITPEAIQAAVHLGLEFNKEEHLPSSATTLLDQGCANTLFEESGNEPLIITQEHIIATVAEQTRTSKESITETYNKCLTRIMDNSIPHTSSLMKFTTDLSAKVLQGEFNQVFGREKELNEAIEILGAIESNNVLWVGPAGCGKTRLGEGLAWFIQQDKVPKYLKDRKVLLFNPRDLIAGTNYRGDLERNIKEFLDSVKKYEDKFILVVDEAHRLMSAGIHSHQATGLADEFKELLGRGKLPMILLTTHQEAKLIKVDRAFYRRFTKSKITPFTPPQAIAAINQEKTFIQTKYQKTHQRSLEITTDAVEAAVYLAPDYSKNEGLPSGAIKLIHITCAKTLNNSNEQQVIVNESDILDTVAQKQNTTEKKLLKKLKKLQAEPSESFSVLKRIRSIWKHFSKMCKRFYDYLRTIIERIHVR